MKAAPAEMILVDRRSLAATLGQFQQRIALLGNARLDDFELIFARCNVVRPRHQPQVKQLHMIPGDQIVIREPEPLSVTAQHSFQLSFDDWPQVGIERSDQNVDLLRLAPIDQPTDQRNRILFQEARLESWQHFRQRNVPTALAARFGIVIFGGDLAVHRKLIETGQRFDAAPDHAFDLALG